MNTDYHILHHSLGISDPRKTAPYRNYFTASEGHHDLPAIRRLIDSGLMKQDRAPKFCDDDCMLFRVTDAGKAVALDTQPREPKRTRGQRRYQLYLDCELPCSFIEWLKDPSYNEYRRTA